MAVLSYITTEPTRPERSSLIQAHQLWDSNPWLHSLTKFILPKYCVTSVIEQVLEYLKWTSEKWLTVTSNKLQEQPPLCGQQRQSNSQIEIFQHGFDVVLKLEQREDAIAPGKLQLCNERPGRNLWKNENYSFLVTGVEGILIFKWTE